jgi:SAM-dependent methyltransferase
MKLSEVQIARLEAFLDSIKAQTYPEPRTGSHDKATEKMLPQVIEWAKLGERTGGAGAGGAKVLDVGCGQGVALERFRDAKLDAIGITLNDEDLRACEAQGYDVRAMDQSFLEFEDGTFDLVWCRHTLEHSIFPYFTLSEFHRVLKPRAWLYVEVPAPDTACHHETNKNHYSVLGRSLWVSLITRSGFTLEASSEITLTVPIGDDVYWPFLARRRD